MNFKLASIHRLKKRQDFRCVFENGVFAANAFLSVHLFKNNEKERRIGFTAGKKLGCAVIRNRCKRRLRECYRLNQVSIPKDMDMVIVARRAMVRASWKKVERAFLDAVGRGCLLAQSKRGI